MLNSKFLSLSLLSRVDVEDDDSNCDHLLVTGNNHASGNEDSESDSDSDSEVEMTDTEDLDLEEAVFDKNAFEMLLMGNQQPGVFEEATFLYQRRPDPSLCTIQRKEKAAQELQDAAEGVRRYTPTFKILMLVIVQGDRMPGSLLINCAILNDMMR